MQMQHALSTMKEVILFTMWQHRFDVHLNFLSYPAPLSLVQLRPMQSVPLLVVVITFTKFH